ncbi:MAG TPA: hypothetical protein VNN22_00380 [Verrucomicrobiae bacterium]|nr:hypothetical protein [Verrucomicrobiae bacterium]
MKIVLLLGAVAALIFAGCAHEPVTAANPAPPLAVVPAPAVTVVTAPVTTNSISPREKDPGQRRSTYTPRVYPVDERGFSPVDKALAKAYAREEIVTNDDEGSLNPYVLKVITGYPLDGSYQYHCSWKPWEYDIYNGVTQDQWYRGMVVAKAYPDGSRCSYCCGFTFEVFIRAMKLRNIQNGLEPDDFNGMTFNDLFNALQLWYIEGKGDSEARAITCYGLGTTVTNFADARPGDFVSYSTTPSGGHSVIFLGWLRDDQNDTNKITGFKYFSSNLSGNGLGYAQTHFSDSTKNGHGVLRNYVNIGHVGAIKDYKPFNRAEIPQRNAYAPTQPTHVIYLPEPVK